jgi:NDP-sugar pyrophosphorylase family protein
MKPTLVILAAGMASRYGSMKQIEGFGPGGETIMDYSIFDAIRTGFDKVVFIIREEFADNFKAIFEPRLEGRIETAYVYQDLTDFSGDYKIPADRKKPWGTAHAVLSAKEVVTEPFAVINADDFYGHDAFKKAADFLTKECREDKYAVIGYDLLKTLSEFGTVNRGVCSVDKNGNLITVRERINISRKEDKIVSDDGLEPRELHDNTSVSMNFWCFHPSYFEYTEQMFTSFLQERGQDPKAEFFIPVVADRFIKEGGQIKVLRTDASWFGVTYKEDAPIVRENLRDLIGKKQYPEKLWDVREEA